MSIDLTITATSRPDLIRRTLTSFCSLLFNPHSSVIDNVFVNIDPIGTHSQHDTVKVFKEFFPSEKLSFHLPYTPSFPKAFIWTWSQTLRTNSSCVFHLEDDWEILCPVDIREMFLLLYLYPDLASLRLSCFPSGNHIMKLWNKMISWNGTFFEVPPNLRGLLGFCGHPTLLRKEFIQTILPGLDDTKNPEKQIKGDHPRFGSYILSHRFGVHQPQDSRPLVRDIGRQWMIDNGFRKAGSKAWFTTWETKDGTPAPVTSSPGPKLSDKMKKLTLVKG